MPGCRTHSQIPFLEFLKEIILVDDHSNFPPAINETFPEAIENLFPPLVKLIQNPERLGLIRARMVGSDKAEGDVILFLDSHCEVLTGWLEPMLQRIKEDYRVVTMPSHDNIYEHGFNFEGASTVEFQGSDHVIKQIMKPCSKIYKCSLTRSKF